jgi:hypothetical protein
MKATYVGHRYGTWEMDGKEGRYTDIYLVRKFPLAEREGSVGDKAVAERVKYDMRPELEKLKPGSLVDVEYDSVGRAGKERVELVGIEPWGGEK